jgi:putative FmdB family regulatory protein
MPIYEYKCGQCMRTHEVLQKLGDAPLRVCPVCRSKELKKLVSVPSIIISERRNRPAAPPVRPGGISLDAVPDEFRHPRLGIAASRKPGT